MLRAITALLALLLTASCAGAGPRGDGSDISFMVFGAPEEVQAYRDLIQAFSEREPDIGVRLVEASDRADLLARLSTSFAGGSPPDLFLINYRFYGQFASKGVLEPLEARLEASEAFSPEDFYPEAMEAFRWDGELTCLPQNVSSLVVYYNRDLFQAAGVPEPPDEWTWDEMVEAAAALTVDEDGDGFAERHGLGVEPWMIRVAPFIWSAGGEVVDDEEHPTRFTVDTPEAREALEMFFDLGRIGVIPSELEMESEELISRFQNGRVAMFLSSRRETPTFRTITDFDWDIAPLPVIEEPAGILHSDAYCMTTASANKDAAWTFVEFALGPEGQPITAATGRTVPSLIEVAESPAFLDPKAKPSRSRVFLDTIPHIRRVPSVSTWPEIEDASEHILEMGLLEGWSVDRVVASLIETTTPIFARAER